MSTLRIPVILGTGRDGRLSKHAADFVFQIIKSTKLETTLIDVRDYASAFTARVEEEHFDDKGLSEKLRAADGYIIVAPEYNHGYPGELKIFLDHFYTEYAQKPIGICSVSNGSVGGARMIEGLRLVLAAFNTVALQRTVMFRKAKELFDEQGKMVDKKVENYEKQVNGMLEQLVWYAWTLKTAREAK